MLSRIAQIALALTVLSSPLLAQGVRPGAAPLKMWYRGSFDGWVELRDNPAPGWYYTPSPDPAYPLHESAYGQPVPCAKCGHAHYPGQDVCPVCGVTCAGGGNNLPDSTVYRQRRLPGQYYYQEQAHYRFPSPVHIGGTYQPKYTRPWH